MSIEQLSLKLVAAYIEWLICSMLVIFVRVCVSYTLDISISPVPLIFSIDRVAKLETGKFKTQLNLSFKFNISDKFLNLSPSYCQNSLERVLLGINLELSYKDHTRFCIIFVFLSQCLLL